MSHCEYVEAAPVIYDIVKVKNYTRRSWNMIIILSLPWVRYTPVHQYKTRNRRIVISDTHTILRKKLKFGLTAEMFCVRVVDMPVA